MHKIKHNVREKGAAFVIGQSIKRISRLFIWAEHKYFATFLVLLPVDLNFVIGRYSMAT
jgi:hypothetical protein